MIVPIEWRGLSSAASSSAVDPERSGHPEVHQQRLAGVELDEQILSAARDRTNATPFEAACKIGRKGPAKVRAAQHHTIDPCAAHHRLQAAPFGLDFRKLWHRRIIAWAPGTRLAWHASGANGCAAAQ